MFSKLLSANTAAGIATACIIVAAASVPAFAQTPALGQLPQTQAALETAPHEQGTAVFIPAYAMHDLLSCRRQQRPEEQCFARLSREVENTPVLAQNNN